MDVRLSSALLFWEVRTNVAYVFEPSRDEFRCFSTTSLSTTFTVAKKWREVGLQPTLDYVDWQRIGE